MAKQLTYDEFKSKMTTSMVDITNTTEPNIVLLPTDNPNILIAIIVDLRQPKIEGYFKLDSEKEYRIK
jgi:hypothetical protein